MHVGDQSRRAPLSAGGLDPWWPSGAAIQAAPLRPMESVSALAQCRPRAGGVHGVCSLLPAPVAGDLQAAV